MRRPILLLTLLSLAVLALPDAPAQAPEDESAAEPAPPLPPLPKKMPAPDLDWKKTGYLATTPEKIEKFTALERPPHPILLILIDALRPDHLGGYGYPRDTTPNLDAFMKEAVSFNRFYVNAPWTRPSTTTILTGLTPTRHRVQCEQHKLHPKFVTLPEALRAAKYRTAGVIGNGNGASVAGLDQGFHHYQDTKFFKGLPNAEQVFDEVLAWTGKNKKRRRTFLFTFIVDPHDPYHGPTPEAERRYLWKGHAELDRSVRVPRWEYARGKQPTKKMRRTMIALYDSAVRYTDEQLGRLFEELKKQGLYDKTTILITADHGDAFGEHQFYKHAHHLWEEVVRVPMLIRSPLIPPEARGKSLDVLASSIDIYPTVMRLAGLGKKKKFERAGVDLFELAAHPDRYESRRVFSEYNCFGINRHMIVGENYKLILQLPADEEEFMATVTRKDLLPSVVFDREELRAFDLDRDFLERKNLVPKSDPKRAPPQIASLLQELRDYIESQPGGESKITEQLDEATEANLRALGYIQ